jgi:hypothetical protein
MTKLLVIPNLISQLADQLADAKLAELLLARKRKQRKESRQPEGGQ